MTKSRFFKFKGLDKKDYALTFREKLFCESFLSLKGNAVEAICKAGYKVKNKHVASTMGNEYLAKPAISAYISLKLEDYGFGDKNVEKQHLFLINQFADLSAKKGAIDLFYKRFGKYAPTSIKFVDNNDDITDEELQKEIANRGA